MKLFFKPWVLILLDVLLFTVSGGFVLYALVTQTDKRDFIPADYVFNGIVISLIVTSVLLAVASIIAFTKKKIVQGILIICYVPIKLYCLFGIYVCYIMLRSGGPPVDDYDSRDDLGAIDILSNSNRACASISDLPLTLSGALLNTYLKL